MADAQVYPSPAEPVPDEFDLLCEGCGYSLVGIMSERCPECGRRIDPNELPLARVPWLYRARIGRVKAYVKTVWAILRNPRGFAKELTRPVRISATDASRFRRVTIRLAWLALGFEILAALAFPILQRSTILSGVRTIEFIRLGIAVSAALIALGIFLRMATDLPTFIWSGLPAKPNDLAPLHCYASAPWLMLPLTVAVGVAGLVLPQMMSLEDPLQRIIAISGFVPLLVNIWKMWRAPQIFMRVATGCGIGRQAALAAYLPIHWVLMAILGLAPLIMVGLVVDSIR
jgi:hypothetical protein